MNQLTEQIKQANECDGFIPDAINVTIMGPNNLDLTLIDFPGVVAKPDDRKKIITMIEPIINKDTAIILAVSR